MKITVVGRHMSVPADLQELAEKKLAKLDKYFATEEKATVTFSRKRNRENIEITIAAANTLFRCETDDETFRNAIDRAVDTIDRQIRKNKTKLEKRLRARRVRQWQRASRRWQTSFPRLPTSWYAARNSHSSLCPSRKPSFR